MNPMEEAQQVRARKLRLAARAGLAIAAVGAMVALAGCSGGQASSDAKGPLDMYTWISSQSDRDQWE